MTMAGGTPGRSHTHCVQANDAKLFASCAMMRRADRGEGRITHGDDTRDGEPLTRGPRAGHDKRHRAHTLLTVCKQMMRSCSLAVP